MTLHALFIGINAYPEAPLWGCINDVLAVSAFFKNRCAATGARFHPRYLLAPHASELPAIAMHGVGGYTLPKRAQLIDAFRHFDAAEPALGDVCLLYYSGHGSQEPAPPEFRHLKADGMNETLVCLDSRQTGGRDLVDKELAWLLWQVTKERPDLHFLVIMDCCHAGSNTRGEAGAGRVRHVPARTTGAGIQDLLGTGQLPGGTEALFDLRDGKAFYRAEGRYVHLAAARDTETAKELAIEGHARGIFTWSLLRVLEQGGATVSYREIMRRTEALVRNRVSGQIPQLDTPVKSLENERFLGGVFPGSTEYPVLFQEGEWRLQAGYLNGLVPGTAAMPAQVQLINGRRSTAAVTAVYAGYAVLETLAEEDPHDGTLRALIHRMPAPQIAIYPAFDPADPADAPALGRLLEAAQQQQRYTDFTRSNADTADYTVRQEAGCYMLCRKDGDIPVFRRQSDAIDFVAGCEAVGKWRFALELHNPEGQLRRDDFSVEIEAIEGQEITPDTLNHCSGRTLNDPEEIVLHYKRRDNDWLQPALRCTVTVNRNGLWAGGLYLDNRFGIHVNLPPRELQAGQRHCFGFESGGVTYNAIPVQLDASLRSEGIAEITDYLKIFVSTHDFSLSDLEQESLHPDEPRRGARRGLGFSAAPRVARPDWLAVTIPVRVIFPLG